MIPTTMNITIDTKILSKNVIINAQNIVKAFIGEKLTKNIFYKNISKILDIIKENIYALIEYDENLHCDTMVIYGYMY